MNITLILQIIIALGLLNVWLLRYTKSTTYRGGNAKNLKDEFAVYGLPVWAHYAVGILKVSAAIALIAGVWISSITFFASLLVVFLMLGALGMHLKIQDPIKKSVPALAMLAMSIVTAWTSSIL
jgi:hypothetical protein